MKKVVYNNCCGGFGLSDKAIELFLNKKGIKFKKDEDAYILLENEDVLNKKDVPYLENTNGVLYFTQFDLTRHDLILVEVVEELGEDANNEYSNLQIKEIKGDRYIIEEYDDSELILEPKDIPWIEIK